MSKMLKLGNSIYRTENIISGNIYSGEFPLLIKKENQSAIGGMLGILNVLGSIGNDSVIEQDYKMVQFDFIALKVLEGDYTSDICVYNNDSLRSCLNEIITSSQHIDDLDLIYQSNKVSSYDKACYSFINSMPDTFIYVTEALEGILNKIVE